MHLTKKHILMKTILILILLSWYCLLSAQNTPQATILADSAEFLVFEDHELERALELNQQAQQLYKNQQQSSGLFHCTINEATYWIQKKEYAKSFQLLEKIRHDIGATIKPNSRLAGLFYTTEAWALWGLTQYDEAYEAAIKGKIILKENKDWERLVDALLLATYAIYYNPNSDFSTIDQHMDSTYQIALEHLPPSRLVFKYIYQLYGSILYQQGRIDRAIDVTHKGLHYEHQLLSQNHLQKDSVIVAKYFSNLGRMYAEKGDIEQGVMYYKNAFIFYNRLSKTKDLIKLCTRIGNMYDEKDKHNEADFYYGKIPAYVQQAPQSPVEQRRDNNFEHIAMAHYYLHFKQYDSLHLYYQQQLPFIKKHRLAIDKAYINIGAAYEATLKYQQAEVYYKKALQLEEYKYHHQGTKIASMYFRLGRLAAKKNNHPLAIQYMDTVIGLLHASPEAEKDKVELLEYLLDKSVAMEAYEARGTSFLALGELQQAHKDFKHVILLANYLRDNYIDNDSKLLSTNKLRPVYEKAALVAWQLYQQNPQNKRYQTAIFDYAEHSKASLLNEHVLKFRNQYTQGGLGIPKNLLQQEEKFMAKIDLCKEHITAAKHKQDEKKEAQYLEELLQLENALDALEKYLQATYPNYRAWDHGRDSIVAPSSVQQHLTADDLFIEYFITSKHLFIVYIAHDKVKIKRVEDFNPRHHKAQVRNLRRTLSNIDFILQYDKSAHETFLEESHALYQQLVKDEMLANKKHLIIVPDRNLNYIPFEVLLQEIPKDTQNINYQPLAYLIRDYSINYEYSAAIMVNTQNRPNTSSGKILGFAATYGEKFSFDQLPSTIKKERTKEEIEMHNTAIKIPGAVDELEELSYYFEGDFFAQNKANEHQFKTMLQENNYSIIHLAMHGVVDYNFPAYSSLMFTENLDSLEDNLLYSYEIQHLNGNHANLVVLSACKTGYGKYAQGEGIISLGRSFMYAGIPSIVMTLWELNDQTSVEVMQHFYYNLVKGQSKDKAMQNAKLQYLEEHNGFMTHPFFWASFICIGNQHPIPINYLSPTWYWWILLVIIGISIIGWLLWRKRKSTP